MAVKSSTTGDISFRSSTVAGNGGPHGGPYRYYRIIATDGTDAVLTANETALRTFNNSTDRQAISSCQITEAVTNTVYPTATFAVDGSDLDGGADELLGPYSQGDISVSAGYSHSSTYSPDSAFGGSHWWWTLGITDASLNYLQIDMLQPRNISKFTIKIRGTDTSSFHHADYTRILASNDPTFATYTIFGILNFDQSLQENGVWSTTIDDTSIEIGAGKVVQISQTGAESTPSIKVNNDITYLSLLEGGIMDEFGHLPDVYKPESTHSWEGGVRFFSESYLSGYYRGLTRDVTGTYAAYDTSGFTDASGTVSGNDGAFFQVSFNPSDSGGTYDTDNLNDGRDTKFTTIIESNRFGSEFTATGASQIEYNGNLKNMFLRNNTGSDIGPYFISGSLISVEGPDSAGVVRLLYYLNYADRGDNNGILNLPSVGYYGDLNNDTSFADFLWHSDKILPLADVPRTDGIVNTFISAAKKTRAAGDTSNADALELQALRRMLQTSTPGRWGTRGIPRYNDSELLTIGDHSVEGNLLKFSDFQSAQKKPELWEARLHFYNTRAWSRGPTEVSRQYTYLSPQHEEDRVMTYYSFKYDTDAMFEQYISGGTGDGFFGSMPQHDTTSAVTEDTNLFGLFWGGSEGTRKNYSQRLDYRDYTFTTVLINHAQLGAEVMDGTDTKGYFSYEGGNLGGNSDDFVNDASSKFQPTCLNVTEGTGDADLSTVDCFPLRGAYSFGGEDNDGEGDYPQGHLEALGQTAGISNEADHPHSLWYVYHIPLPLSEIGRLKVRFVGQHASKRFAVQDVFMFPGKWECVTNSFKSPERTGLQSFTFGSSDVLGPETQQAVNYGDLMIHTVFDDFAFGPQRPTLDISHTNVDYNHIHEQEYRTYQSYAGGARTTLSMIMDPDDPTKTSSAGNLALEVLQRPGTVHYDSYPPGNAVQKKMHSVIAQSFVMRCVDT